MLFWLPIIVSSLIGGVPEEGTGLIQPVVTASPGHRRSALSRVLVGAAAGLKGKGVSNTSSPVTMLTRSPSDLTGASLSSSPSAATQSTRGGGGASLPVLLSSVPFIVTAIASIWLGRSSQARGERTLHLALPYLTAGILFAGESMWHWQIQCCFQCT